MRISLIEDLPMASSTELYQLSWAIEQVLADPCRIVQARGELQPVNKFSTPLGR